MPFYLNDERAAAMESARQFAQEECAKWVEKCDKEEYFPIELMRRAGELGLLGIGIPEEEGGSGFDCVTLCLVAEEISKVLPAFGQIMMAHTGLTLQCLRHLQDEELRNKWLPAGCDGTAVGATCITEPCGNSDMSGWQTSAVRDGDDYIINGEKIFCTNIGAADFYLVNAKTADAIDISKGFGASMFFVEKGTPGVQVEKIEDKIGWRGSSTGTITFKDVRVPATNMIFAEHYSLGMQDARYELIAEGACALGIAEGAYDKALAFARSRTMPDGMPYYFRHETMRTRITEMKMEIETMRSMTYMYADMFDKGENVMPGYILIKPYTAKTACDVCSTAIDLFGGIGVCRDVDIERYWREAKVCMVGGGQYDIQLDSAGLVYGMM